MSNYFQESQMYTYLFLELQVSQFNLDCQTSEGNQVLLKPQIHLYIYCQTLIHSRYKKKHDTESTQKCF